VHPGTFHADDAFQGTTEGFLRGTATIEGLDGDRGARMEIAFQNEWAVAWRDGVPVVTTPDLICVLNAVTGEAIGTETLRYGQRVAVVALPAPPVLVGHSMGGFVVQKYLEDHKAPGAVLMCAVPPQGLMSAAMGMMFSKPGMMKDLNSLMSGGKASLETLREALFAQEVSLDDLKRYYKGSQSESHRAIWDMSLFGMPRTGRVKRTPLLVQGAEFDHLIPASLVEMTARSYGVEANIFSGMGHGLMLERDWKKPAQQILDWLGELES